MRSVTVDCNIKDLGCSNVAGVPVEMLQEDICQALLLIPTVTRLFTANPSFLEMETSPVFDMLSCTIHSMSIGNESYGDSSG